MYAFIFYPNNVGFSKFYLQVFLKTFNVLYDSIQNLSEVSSQLSVSTELFVDKDYLHGIANCYIMCVMFTTTVIFPALFTLIEVIKSYAMNVGKYFAIYHSLTHNFKPFF